MRLKIFFIVFFGLNPLLGHLHAMENATAGELNTYQKKLLDGFAHKKELFLAPEFRPFIVKILANAAQIATDTSGHSAVCSAINAMANLAQEKGIAALLALDDQSQMSAKILEKLGLNKEVQEAMDTQHNLFSESSRARIFITNLKNALSENGLRFAPSNNSSNFAEFVTLNADNTNTALMQNAYLSACLISFHFSSIDHKDEQLIWEIGNTKPELIDSKCTTM